MTNLTWVVGSGGLLGSHVRRAVEHLPHVVPWSPSPAPFRWGDKATLDTQLRAAVEAFLRSAASGGHERWTLLWCAGSGVVGSSAADLAEELRTWRQFLTWLSLGFSDSRTRSIPGQVFLASSAGGVYGGSSERPISEDSDCRPISEYGSVQLLKERSLDEWARGQPQISTLVARISNLYGPGQKMDKPQGLISQLSRCLIYRQAIHIYVPLDTIRDYLFVEDAARWIVGWTQRLGQEAALRGEGRRALKICASEEETTIAALIGGFQRIAKRQLKVIFALHPVRNQQAARLQFRSRVWLDEPRPTKTGLLVGMDRVYRHQLAVYQGGRLPGPRPRAGWGWGSGAEALEDAGREPVQSPSAEAYCPWGCG